MEWRWPCFRMLPCSNRRAIVQNPALERLFSILFRTPKVLKTWTFSDILVELYINENLPPFRGIYFPSHGFMHPIRCSHPYHEALFAQSDTISCDEGGEVTVMSDCSAQRKLPARLVSRDRNTALWLAESRPRDRNTALWLVEAMFEVLWLAGARELQFRDYNRLV